MLEKITYITSAALASTLAVAIFASGVHAKDVMKAAIVQTTKFKDDKHLSLDVSHHNHVHRFVVDTMQQKADPRDLRKYIRFGEKDAIPLLD